MSRLSWAECSALITPISAGTAQGTFKCSAWIGIRERRGQNPLRYRDGYGSGKNSGGGFVAVSPPPARDLCFGHETVLFRVEGRCTIASEHPTWSDCGSRGQSILFSRAARPFDCGAQSRQRNYFARYPRSHSVHCVAL